MVLHPLLGSIKDGKFKNSVILNMMAPLDVKVKVGTPYSHN